MGGAFFFMSARSRRFSFRRCAAIHASACVACFSIRGVHLIAPGAPLLRPSLAHHLVLAVLMPIPQMCPISCMRLRKKISERTCGINISNTSPHSSRRTRAACSRLTRQHATSCAAIRLSTCWASAWTLHDAASGPRCTIAARAEQVARDLGVCAPWRQSRPPRATDSYRSSNRRLACFKLS